MSLLLAVDVGTRAARAGLFDAAGTLVATASAGFELLRPEEGHAVYVMDEIWRAVGEAVRACVRHLPVGRHALAGIAFDATSSLVLNHTGRRPLAGDADVFCWMDHRGEPEAERITATGDQMLRYMGGSFSPEMHLPKLLWLREHQPNGWMRVTGVRDLCDELARRATGEPHHSLCGIACKWPYLPGEREPWRRDLLERLGLGGLPALGSLGEAPRMVGALHGVLTEVAAADFGVSAGIPVAVGLIDAEAGMLGTLGCSFASRIERTVAVIGGTSTCIMAFADQERIIPGVWGPFKDAVIPGLWLHEAGQSSSGAALDAVLTSHPAGPHRTSAELHARVAREIEAILNSDGPIFAAHRHVVPDWLGNRSPLGDGRVRALLSGVGTEETYRSFLETYYAVARGLVLQVRQIIEHMNGFGYRIARLLLSGGQLRNSLLVRLYRDATSVELATARAAEPVLLGTAMLAAVAGGAYRDIPEALDAMSMPQDELPADPAWAGTHERAYRAYLALFVARNAVARTTIGMDPAPGPPSGRRRQAGYRRRDA
ncbi:MAG: FGGY-family carbohydrate kinase [Acetobacteraceae bacterium]